MIDKSILSVNLNDSVSYQEYFHAFGYADDDSIFLRTFNDRTKDDYGENQQVKLKNLNKMIPWMTSAATMSRGLFYVVNGNGNNDKAVLKGGAAKAQFMEMDDFQFEDQIDRINQFSLEPSVIVKTAKSLHCYWLLDNGDISRFREIQELLIAHFDGDPVIKNESRVMRLYGFYHMKHDPVMVTLIKFDPMLRYTQDQIEQALEGQKRKKPKSNMAPKDDKKVPPVKEEHKPVSQESDDHLLLEHHRTDGMMSLAARLRNTGVGEAAIKEAIIAENQRRCIPPLTDKELEREVFPCLTRPFSSDLSQFHRVDKRGNVIAVIDYRIFQYLTESIDMFVYGGIVYYYLDGVYVPDVTGAYIKSRIKELIVPEFIRSSTIDRIHRLFLIDDKLQATDNDLNNYPCEWINFKNGFYDPVNRKMIPHDPKYRSLNQIPHIFEPGKKTVGSEVDKWLQHIAPADDDRKMLLQFCGICMNRDTRQQKFLLLTGIGGSGKSTLLSLLEYIVGSDNTSNVPLEKLSVRFASYGLVGKLMNSCADLKTGVLEDTSVIKKALGEDPLDVEPKGKDPFSVHCYAKHIFSSNELPLVVNERTNGFYRRLLILRVDQVPKRVRYDFQQILRKEVDHFIRLIVDALSEMYDEGIITESRQSLEAVKNLRRDSDSVQAWIEQCCTIKPEARTDRTRLKESYEVFCQWDERTALNSHNFYRAVASKGFKAMTSQGVRYFTGISLGK